MKLEILKWSTMPAPTDPKVWPCMICRNALATHRRVIRLDPTIITLIVCIECGQASDNTLRIIMEGKLVEDPLARVLRRLAE